MAIDREDLVLRHVTPVSSKSTIIQLVKAENPVNVLWCPPAEQPHLGSLAPLSKVADFLQAGCDVKVLLTDGPSLLESLHISAELAKARVAFRERLFRAALSSLDASLDLSRLTFLTGLPNDESAGALQRHGDWTMGFYSLASVTARDAARAAADGLSPNVKNAPLSELLLPIVQAVDEQSLAVDIHYGRAEQRSSFAFAEAALTPLGLRSCAHLISPPAPDYFRSTSTSTVDPNLYFHDGAKKKVNTAFAEEGNVHGNGLLDFVRAVIFPISCRRSGASSGSSSPFVVAGAPEGTQWSINRDEKYGGPLHFASADDVEAAYASRALHPKDLKSGVLDAVNALAQPVVEAFGGQAQLKAASEAVYPPPKPAAATVSSSKKEKKAKKAKGEELATTNGAATGTAQRSEQADDAAIETKIELITRGLHDDGLQGAGVEAMRRALREGRELKLYWGTATTGRPHIGYFVPLTKVADYLEAGVRVKILLADVHGFLDNLKAPISLIRHRTEYYSLIIRAVFKSIGVSTDRLEFIVGTSFELSPAYIRDVLRITDLVSEHDAKKAGAEVVKQTEKPPLSGLIYPLMQALDEEHLGVDIQFGGVDQRKIFTLARESLPKLGYVERSHLMNAMIPGLQGGKMSSSEIDSKIDFLDPPDLVNHKLATSVADPAAPVEGNGLLAFARAVLFPVASLRLRANGRSPFVTATAPETALLTVGTVNFEDATALENAFVDGTISPDHLRSAIATCVNLLLAPVLADFEADETFRKVEALAYPSAKAEALANGVAEIALVDARS